MNSKIATGLFDSAATFKKHTAWKTAFICLGLLDLVLTVQAVNMGLFEMNPFIRFLVQIPVLMLTVKLLIPVLIAWLMPGRLLLPSVALLAMVNVWNIKELIVFCC